MCIRWFVRACLTNVGRRRCVHRRGHAFAVAQDTGMFAAIRNIILYSLARSPYSRVFVCVSFHAQHNRMAGCSFKLGEARPFIGCRSFIV